MSLNNLSLPPQLLADLYGSSLVQAEATAATAKGSLPSLGENKKNILILVNQQRQAYLPEKELAFLTTVLSACHLGLADVAIVNCLRSSRVSLDGLLHQFLPKKILLLNVKPEAISLPFSEQFAVQAYGGIDLLCAPSLQEIKETKQSKSRFWVALKQLFCL